MAAVATQTYIEDFDLTLLVPHPKNPRIHDEESIGESIEANDFVGAIYAQAGTNYILSGHGRVKQLLAKGVTTGPVLLVECDDDAAERLVLALNRVGEKSSYDVAILAELLGSRMEAGDLVGTGYSPDDVDNLLLAADPGSIELPPQEFTGGFVETDDEQETRAARVAETKESIGLKEVVLVYDSEQYEQVKNDVRIINAFHEASSTSEVVKIALRKYAEDLDADLS